MGSYLLAMSLFSVLILSLMSATLHHYWLAAGLQQRQAAKNLAESALQQALLTVLKSPEQAWGSQALAGEKIEVASEVYPGGRGVLAFNPQVARDLGVAPSVNNLRRNSIVPGSFGRQVPINSLQLVACGQVGSSRRTVEMIYHLPPFPNSLASEGPVKSRGGLLVGAVLKTSDYQGDYSAISPENRAPAHVVSNSSASDAVDLGDGAVVHGNVGAVGGVRLEPNVRVDGEVRQGIERQRLPQLDLNGLFQRSADQLGSDALPADLPRLELPWNAHRDGDLRIQGDLVLEGGMLLVRGNLTVGGGISGSGAVFVDGETRILRGARFEAAHQVALVSRRRVQLDGSGRDSYYFQGLVYTEAEVVANHLTVLGAIIARGVGGMELNDVSLINSPVTVNLVQGVEFNNYSDDDTVRILVRVLERDPVTLKATRYKVQMRGYSDEPRSPRYPVEYSRGSENISEEVWSESITSYQQLVDFIRGQQAVAQGYAKNNYRTDWYWRTDPIDPEWPDLKAAVDPLLPNALESYLKQLDGEKQVSRGFLTMNLDPNQALGVLDRPRVLLWREVHD